MNELFLEIQEDLNRERYERLWRSFGRVMVWVSVAVVAATVVFVVWQNHRRDVSNEKTGQLIKGADRLNIEDYQGAVPVFSALTDDDDSRYYGIAMLRKAQAQELAGDKDGATKTYAALSSRSSEFAELAKLKVLAAGGPAEVAATSPFYYSLTEDRAWQLLSQDKTAEAVELFAALAADSNAPHSLVMRAREVVQHLAPEKAKANAS